MIFFQSLMTALSSLWTKKIRSLLTMLGIIIGVAQIIVLIGLGQGVKNQVTDQVTDLGSNLLFILPGKVDTSQGGFNPAATAGSSTLTEQDVALIRQQPDVQLTAPVSLLTGVPFVGDKSALGSLIVATEPAYFQIMTNITLAAGRTFTEAENSSQAHVMVIGATAKRSLFPDVPESDVIGKTVQIGKNEFTVIGTTAGSQSASAFGGNETDSFIFIPYATAKVVNPNTQIYRMAVRTNPAADIKKVAQQIRDAMKAEHGTEDFTVFTQEDLLKVVDNILGLITKAIVGLSSISLLVGGIGIMNIMLVAVTERTKEIGLRKALGATKIAILSQFLMEAIVLSLFGGAIGVAIATTASIIVKQKADLSIVVDWHSILVATLFSLGVGVIFGFLPAFRAARKDPIEALRYE